MSQPTPTTDERPSDATPFEPITSNEDFEERAKKRIEREVAKRTAKYADYDQLKAQAAELAQVKQAGLSEADKQAQRMRELEAELQAERHGNLRRDVAAEIGVPADNITGSTREELVESATRLREYIAKQQQEQTVKPDRAPRPSAGLKSGATGTNTRMDPMEQAANAVRQWASGALR